MIRMYPGEQFQEIELEHKLRRRYAISNRGRLVSFTDTPQNGLLLKGSLTDGYRTLGYTIYNEGAKFSRKVFLYKLVAKHFIPKDSEDQKHVLHLDFKRDNDVVENLKWATYEEMQAHRYNSPHVARAKQKLLEHNLKSDGRKLSITKVMHIKTLLKDPNRKTRLKMLAKQFGVSEMQIRRIQSGENWSYIKV